MEGIEISTIFPIPSFFALPFLIQFLREDPQPEPKNKAVAITQLRRMWFFRIVLNRVARIWELLLQEACRSQLFSGIDVAESAGTEVNDPSVTETEASQAAPDGAGKYSIQHQLRPGVKTPADETHGGFTAARTCLHVNAEALKKDISGCIGRKARLESLMTLKPEQDPEFLLLDGACQETEVTDLLKAFGKDMHQEPADELIMGDSHLFSGIAIPVVAIPEGNGMVRDLKDAGIRDGDTMGVATKVIDGIAEAVEGFLEVGAPVSSVELV